MHECNERMWLWSALNDEMFMEVIRNLLVVIFTVALGKSYY